LIKAGKPYPIRLESKKEYRRPKSVLIGGRKMATFRNRHGKWQARVQRKGQKPVSKSFQSKEDAQRWARQVEAEIDKGSYTNIAVAERTQFKDVIERYVQEVILKSRSMKEATTASGR
jgi:succinylarginine dihydrolase